MLVILSYTAAMQLVRGAFSEKFEKLRHRPRPGLEPSTERKSKIILLQNAPHELHRHRVDFSVIYPLFGRRQPNFASSKTFLM